MRVVVGSVALSFLLALVLGVSGLVAPGGGTALGASTTLTIISGEVLVSRDGGPFKAAIDGAVMRPGDSIRTLADARAVLTYFEGSTVSIEPSSELAIDEATSAQDGSTVVLMTQNLGRTWHVVTKLITGGSRYEVRTPAATASVRGTAFEVGVRQDAGGAIVTEVVTAEGVVAAAAPPTTADPRPEPVVVNAGFKTTTRSTERKPEPPQRAAAPARTVEVAVQSDNTLVVDPLGRANGIKDGKLVIQTPGATVTSVDGKLVVTMPHLPDGKLSTVVRKGKGPSDARVEVVTTVRERGKQPTTVSEILEPRDDDEDTTTGVEVRHSGPAPGATPDVRRIEEDELKDLPAPKTAIEPDESRPGLGPDPRVISAIRENSGGRFVGEMVLGALPGAQTAQERRRAEDAQKRADDERKRADEQARQSAEVVRKAAEEAAKRAEDQARLVALMAAERAKEQAKQAEETVKRNAEAAKKAAEDQAKLDEERRQAEQAAKRAAEDAQRLAQEAARRAEQEARRLAEERAEQAAKQAEEAAKRAAEAAKRLAEEAHRAAKAALEQARDAAKADLEAAKARVAEAKEAFELAKDGIDPAAILEAGQQLDGARAEKDRAERDLERIESALDSL